MGHLTVAPSVGKPESLAPNVRAYTFGGLRLGEDAFQSARNAATRSFAPERFRGGCSFGGQAKKRLGLTLSHGTAGANPGGRGPFRAKRVRGQSAFVPVQS
jgi:hypothetical protein